MTKPSESRTRATPETLVTPKMLAEAQAETQKAVTDVVAGIREKIAAHFRAFPGSDTSRGKEELILDIDLNVTFRSKRDKLGGFRGLSPEGFPRHISITDKAV